MLKTLTLTTALLIAGSASAATVVLYDQDFEAPTDYVNDGGDINLRKHVNALYGGQPAGFLFKQAYTVETLNITGSQRGGGVGAYYNTANPGYKDPSGKGGDFAIGLQSRDQNDLLGLTFDAGSHAFFNVALDFSSIDLTSGLFGAPFVPTPMAPKLKVSVFDNPGGGLSTGTALTLLDSTEITASASARDTFDWSSYVLGFDISGATNGNVTLQFDLLSGNYAAFDNLRIAASDTKGDVGAVPLPAGGALLAVGLGILGGLRRRR